MRLNVVSVCAYPIGGSFLDNKHLYLLSGPKVSLTLADRKTPRLLAPVIVTDPQI